MKDGYNGTPKQCNAKQIQRQADKDRQARTEMHRDRDRKFGGHAIQNKAAKDTSADRRPRID